MEVVLTARAGLSSRLLECGSASAPLLLCVHGGGCDSGYFDLKGFSVAETALARGFDVLLVDRPGYGRSAPPLTANPVGEAAARIADHLASVLTERGSDHLVVIGHSIGGAVAMALAAEARLAIRAVAVSGIGRVPSAVALAWLADAASGAHAQPEPPPEFFFGPDGSYDWRGPLALRKVARPWRRDELGELASGWPARFDAMADAITVPVSFYLAEHERIWRANADDVADAAARFGKAPVVDAGVLPGGGHLYEIHRRGGELAERQLAFLSRACPPAPSS